MRRLTWEFKVAEHSFSARFCSCKLARAQGFQKTNMPSTERSFYLLNTRTICVIFRYNCMQCIDGSNILSLNHKQQQPKVGTTSVSQMCNIRHSMTEGSQLFSFKTIMKCCLLPKVLVSKSKECVCNIFPPSV